MSVLARTLAIETASEACSVALFDGNVERAGDHRILGRGHAEQLVPMIANLPGHGRADRIIVSLGPGSFTGVRIGIATARALGFAWGADLFGYPTLALVAAQAAQSVTGSITVCMNGGHGEWFVQHFDRDGAAGPVRSLTPEQAIASKPRQTIVGSKAREFVAMLGDEFTALDLLPDARMAMLLEEDAGFSETLNPIYGRGPDARPLAEQRPR